MVSHMSGEKLKRNVNIALEKGDGPALAVSSVCVCIYECTIVSRILLLTIFCSAF